MNFSVTTNHLVNGLKAAGRAINSNATLPVLANVLIEAKRTNDGEEYLSVAGTDLEIALRTRVRANVEQAGSVTLPAKLLSNLLTTWPSDQVINARLDPKTQTLRLECEAATASIKGITADEYPLIADPSEWTNVGLDAFDLRVALDRVVFAAASDESRPILTGVYVHSEDGRIHFAAADGFRLSHCWMEADVEGAEELDRGVTIPSAALRELARLVPGAGKPVYMCFKPGQLAQVAFVVYDRDDKANAILTSQLIGGNFPDYQQIIPKTRSLRVTASTRALETAVAGALVFSSYNVNIVKWHVYEEKGLIVQGHSAEMGEQEAQVAVEADGQMDQKHCQETRMLGHMAINGSYALDALRAVGTAQVVIDLNTPSSPLALKPEGDDSFVHVLMPMHTSQ